MRLLLLLFSIASLVVLFARPATTTPVAGMTGLAPGPRGQDAAAVVFQGDVNCDGVVEVDDALLVLQSTASLSASGDCMAQASNVDCSAGTDVVDALLTLKYVAHVRVSPMTGCPPVGYLTAGTPPGEAAVALAQRITGGYDLGTVVTAVNDAFSYAGVGVGVEGDLIVQARPPETEEVVIPMEALRLALEARDRASVYRITADDLGQMLADFGWPFGDGSTPGEQFAAFTREWVTEAQTDPQGPRNFVPLFLAEMAESGEPPVDLGTEVPPDEMVFSTLEVELILAEFDRETDPAPAAGAGVAQPQAVTPCSDANKYLSENLGPFAGQLTGVAVSEGVSRGIEKGLVKAGVSSSNASEFGNAMSAVATIARLWKLIAFYNDAQVNVTIDGDNPQHKRPESDPGPLLKLFQASAGVSEEDWKAYQDKYGELGGDINSAVRDCLSQAGIPTLADLSDIANDAENWAVEWWVYGDASHVSWSPDQQAVAGAPHQGHWRANLKRPPGSGYSADTVFIAEIPGEDKDADHPGYLNDAPVKVCAEVDASQPPSLGTFVNAAKGALGLADAIAELAGGWLQKMVKPTSCGLLTVTWHEAGVCPGVTSQSSAEQARSALVILAAEQPPCAYEGSANVDVTVATGFGRGAHFTATASNLRFEMDLAGAPIYGYDLVAGSVTWEVSGPFNDADCSVSGGGTIDVATVSPAQPPYSDMWGGISLNLQENNYSFLLFVSEGMSSTDGNNVGPLTVTCGGTPFQWLLGLAVADTDSALDPHTLADTQTLQGSIDRPNGTHIGFTGPSHYEWDLHAETCPHSLSAAGGGVCQ